MKRSDMESYWAEIRRILVDDLGLDKNQAKFGVSQYRKMLRRERIGLVVFHARHC